MNDIVFANSFSFNELVFTCFRHSDVSGGAGTNFLAVMKTGSAKIKAGDVTLHLKPDDVFFIPKGLKYHSYWTPDGTVSWDSYGFLHCPDAKSAGLMLQKIPCDRETRLLLSTLSENKEVSFSSVGLLYTIMARLLPRMKRRDTAGHTDIYETVIKALHTDTAVSVETLAARCGISVSGLYAMLRREFDTTPHALRVGVITEKAVDLLTNTDIPVETVSDMLGFSSPSYFRKCLKAQTGKSPRDIRKEACF